MDQLVRELGKKVSYVELSTFLGVDRKWVLEHADELGGVRIGKRLLFFENLIVDCLRGKSYAIQKNAKRADSVGCASSDFREPRMQHIHDKGGSDSVGSQDAERARASAQEVIAHDKYGLFCFPSKLGKRVS